VKPSNVLVDRRGNAYLTDFGLAALLDEDLSQDGAGTPAFMPPEQARGQAGPAADQFALARTLAVLLAGAPVAGDPCEALPASIHASVVAVLRRAMSPDPAARFPTIAAFARALAGSQVHLGEAEAPMRLAAEVRLRAPFAWAAGATSTRRITHEIGAADYTLSDLVKGGFVSEREAEKLRERTGYAELAWTMYAHEGRLGPTASDGAVARASDVVVFLHGLLCTRADWADAAIAVCRDNAEALVLVPDLFGCGQSRYAAEEQAAPLASLRGTIDAVVAWLDQMSVRDLPTVLCGHSYSGVALLVATDEALGDRVSRVAITPGIHDAIAPSAAATAAMVHALARFVPKALRPAIVRWLRDAADFKRLDDDTYARLGAEFVKTPSWLMTRLARENRSATLAPAECLRRCTVLLSEDDEYYPADRVAPFLVARGIPPEFIQRIDGCGHYPTLEQKDAPEARARNIGHIVMCVDVMLTASREGGPRSTVMASTIVGA
jgi:hypothetical protein